MVTYYDPRIKGIKKKSIKYWSSVLKEKNEEVWLSPMTKAPTPKENSKKQHDNTKTATKNSD